LRSRLGRAGAKLQLRKEQKKQLLDLGTQLEDLVREHAAQRTRSAWRPLILRTSTAPSRQTAIKPESDARTHKALKKYISATLKPQYSAALSKREARLNAKPRNPKPVEDAGSLLRRELADMGERQLIQLDDGEYDEYGPKKNKGRDQKPLGSAGLEATYWRGVWRRDRVQPYIQWMGTIAEFCPKPRSKIPRKIWNGEDPAKARSPAPNLDTQKHFNEWYVVKDLGNELFDGTQPYTSATATIDAPAHDSAVVNSSEIQKLTETNANLNKDALAKKKRKHGGRG
jgi:hypothetical protein